MWSILFALPPHFRFQGHKNSRRQRTSTKDNFTLEEAEAALPSTDEEKYTHMYKNFGSDFWNFCQGLHHLLYMYSPSSSFLCPHDILERGAQLVEGRVFLHFSCLRFRCSSNSGPLIFGIMAVLDGAG